MADKGIFRQIRLVYDRVSGKKAEQDLADSLTAAGKKGGESFLTELRKAFAARMADLKVQLAKGLIDQAQFKKLGNDAAKTFNEGLVKGMEQARASGNLTESVYQKLARQLKSTGDVGESAWSRIKAAIAPATAALAAFFGARELERFGTESIKRAAESEKVWNSLSGTIEAAGGHWKELAAEVREAGEAFESTTVHSHDDYAKGLQRLIILTGDSTASIHNMAIAADVAARFTGGDLMAAVELVAKGMSTGLVPIARGVKITLQELADRSLGGASEATQTFTGRMKQLANSWEKFQEVVGNTLVGTDGPAGAIETLGGIVQSLTGWVSQNTDAIRDWGRGVIETIRTILQASGALSITAGNAPFQPAKNEKGLNAQAKVLFGQRAQQLEEVKKAQKALDDVLALPMKFRDDRQIASLRGDLKGVNDELDQIDANLRKVDAAREAIRHPAPDTSKAMLSKNLVESDADKSQRKHFEDLKADLELQVTGLQRVADATSQGKDATDLANQSLKDEEELRKSLKDLTPQQAAVIGPLVKQLQEQRRAVDDLAAAEQFRIDQEKVYADFRKENEARLNEVTKGQQALALLEATNAATDEGVAALQRLQREQFILNGLVENHIGLADKDRQRWVAALGAMFDKQHQVSKGWQTALGAVEDAAVSMFEAFADGGVKGIAAYASQAAKLMAAEAIGALAHGFAALALGPIGGKSASDFFEAAAVFGSASAAFGIIGSTGGSSVSASGGAGSGGGPSSFGASSKPQGPDVTIILTGHLSALDPQIQEIIAGAQQETRQRYGENTVIRVVGGKAA